MVSQAVGYDAFQKVKRRKRFVTVDTLGLVLRVLVTHCPRKNRAAFVLLICGTRRVRVVVRLPDFFTCKTPVTAASVDERSDGKPVLKKVKQMGNTVPRLHTIWVDGGYDGNQFMHWVMDFCRWVVQVVLRAHEHKGNIHKGNIRLPKHWVVERTLNWLTGCRRLNKDYELLPQISEAFITLP
ncbi:transposase [Kalymmatonema gypsitolerans NIES-4073]|nr:transposase [Scytonema sp. NIES-4073]